MDDRFGRSALATVAGLIIVGVIVWWLLKGLLVLAFYLLVGALAVYGGRSVYRHLARSSRRPSRRRIPRR